MTYYVIAVVPAASRPNAESAVAPYLLSPNAPGVFTFSVPLSPDGTGAPTYYGCCAPVPDSATLIQAIPGLVAAFPGTQYQMVDVQAYNFSTHWIGWLAAQGLTPIVPTQGP